MSDSEIEQIESLLGRYVMRFSHIEMLMVQMSAKLVAGSQWTPLVFATKRLTADQKREILHRAIEEKLSGSAAKVLKPLLSKLQDEIKRRNDLLHGTYMPVARGGSPSDRQMTLGRIGDYATIGDDLAEITVEELAQDIDRLQKLQKDLLLAFIDIPRPPND